MPEILALTGLVIATLLYLLLVRRRVAVRDGIASLSRALSASNDIAMARMSRGFREHRPAVAPDAPVERRSGQDRRGWTDRRRGRGRRAGGDRRRGASTG
jgi:hypothetical protein